MATSASEIIFDILNRSDLKPSKVSKELGFSQSSNFKKVLDSSNDMRISTLIKICDYLGFRIVIERKEYKEETANAMYRYEIDGHPISKKPPRRNTAKEAFTTIINKDRWKNYEVAEAAGFTNPSVISRLLSPPDITKQNDMKLNTFLHLARTLKYKVFLFRDHTNQFFHGQEADEIFELEPTDTIDRLIAASIHTIPDNEIAHHLHQAPSETGDLKSLAAYLRKRNEDKNRSITE